MIDTEKMLCYIIESGLSITTISQRLNLSAAAFMRRLANIDEFTVKEADNLCLVLNIPKTKAAHIFFA